MNKLQQAYHDTYKIILGRNIYSQNLRSYVYTPYGGKYYSDCSSSICATMNKIGVSMSQLNTAGMYYSSLWKEVDVNISAGHVDEVTKLRVGDALMFIGSDASRPQQIGHVESVYEINGTSENNIILAGHGSGNPTTKNMYDYLDSRYNQYASNGKRKGLVCVLRAILDSSTSGGISADGTTSTGNIGVSVYQKWLNTYYPRIVMRAAGAVLIIDNKWGAKTYAASLAVWKDLMNWKYGCCLTVGNNNFAALCKAAASKALIQKGSSGTLVAIAEGILTAKEYYTNAIDAKFGNGMDAAVKAFQKARRLTVDGQIGSETWYALFN